MDPVRVLEPVRALRRATLERYEGPKELAAAVRAAAAAVDRSLRMMLRADTGAPDELRMAALSPSELSLDRVLAVLRERERISLELAGRVHELRQAEERAAAGSAAAADADLALRVLDKLEEDVHAVLDQPVRDAAHHAVEEGPLEPTRPVPPARKAGGRGIGLLLGVLALAALVVAVLVVLLGRGPDMGDAIAAFERGERVQASVLFQRVLEDEPRNETALLYLARIERRAGRHAEAAEYLQRAAAEAPEDPDVRRELGHLFMELGRPASAADQYQRAVELDPDGTIGWIGLVRALRAAGDTTGAAAALRRAPEEARSVLRGG